MKAATAEESRAADAKTIAAGTPGIVLMERASSAVAREIARAVARRPERARRVVVVCGTGNNGGDGFETARLLTASRLGSVETILLGDPSKLGGDAAETFRRLGVSGGPIAVARTPEDLEPIRNASLVVDAIYGTGLSRPIEAGSLAARALALVSAGPAFVVAVDVPSGLDGSRAEIPGPHAVADITVTFGSPKVAHVSLPAAGACGRLVVADIGLRETETGGDETVTARDLVSFFPRRKADAHKGSQGRLAVAGGSMGLAGAVGLAARASHRSGAGLVTVLAPENVRPLAHLLSPESTTASFDADLSRFDALALGPGLGLAHENRFTFRRLAPTPLPAVFDADALTLGAEEAELFAARRAPTVLTPHAAEAARLLATNVDGILADRAAAARAIAKRYDAVVVLKGFRSVVAAPDGREAIVLAGNPGMATGGMGDVLTGVIGALLARGLSAWDAGRAATWLHGTAGDLAREALAEESLRASDVVEALPDAFRLVSESRLP